MNNKEVIEKTLSIAKKYTNKPILAKAQPTKKVGNVKVETLNDVVLVPLDGIFTNKELFQNREADYSEESVKRILKAVDEKTFNWAMFDPILLWKNPTDNKLYILSGHSRTHAFKELAKKNTKYHGRHFDKIPAKIVEATQEEAVKMALTSNILATKETDVERAKLYRKMRNEGATKKEIYDTAYENEGKNARRIINLSYLNPKGRAIELLNQFNDVGSTHRSIIDIVAEWVGEAREKFDEFTNSHENQLTHWLIEEGYGDGAGKFKSKIAFLDFLQVVYIHNLDKDNVFDDKKLLVLSSKHANQSRGLFKDYERNLDILKRETKESEVDLCRTSMSLTTLLSKDRITEERYTDAILEKAQILIAKRNKLKELEGKKEDIIKADKQQTSLF